MRVWRMTALKTADELCKEVLLEDEQAEDKNPGGEPYQILPAPDDLLPALDEFLPAPDDFLPVPDVSLSVPDSCLPAHEDR
jgi:hypothetical protein